MQLYKLPKTKGINRKKKRLGKGHGTGHGKTSGKGHKGGKARSGYSVSPTFEGGQTPIARRMPGRGFSNARFMQDWSTVNVADLEKLEAGDVNIDTLITAGLIRNSTGLVKILGNGELTKSLNVTVDAFSASAKRKIEAASGKAVTPAT